MAEPEPSLADKIVRPHATLTAADVPHAFGGALALAYDGEPRTTVDVDLNLFVEPTRYEAVLELLEPLGIDRAPAASEVVRAGQGRLWWGRNPVDLFFAHDPVHEAMQRDVRGVPFGDDTIPILAAEHLVVAKSVFDRPKDWLDIEQIVLAVPDLDRTEIDRWLEHLVG